MNEYTNWYLDSKLHVSKHPLKSIKVSLKTRVIM